MTTLLEPTPAPSTDAPTIPASLAPEPDTSALDSLDRRLHAFAEVARWATLSLGILIGLITGPVDATFLVVALVFFGYSALSSRRPIPLDPPDERAGIRIALELFLVVLGVTATGATHSPFVLAPMTAMVVAGYVWGDRLIRGSAIVASVATLFAITLGVASGAASTAANLGLIFLLCGLLGTFGRSSLVQVEVQRAAALDQITQMGTANELLVALHTVAQTLPASLDLGEVITSTRNRLRALLDFSALTILVRDDTGDGWRVELAEGLRLPATLPLDELPRTLQFAATTGTPVVVGDLLAPEEDGCAPLARSGLYAPLRTRGSVVGLIAIEHLDVDAYTSRDADLVANLSGLVALSIDNAKWFGRLRLFGAEAERARIARDLHDRIGQSLAYVAFELERLRDSGEHREELDALHDFVRSIVTELRETLYQLRASVTEEHDLSSAASEFLSRFEERTGVRVHWSQRVHHRLPLPLEQEVWRILQEAVTNVERHAHASNLHVAWEVIGNHARLEIRDDGDGFDPGAVGGDHYGLIGARERADAIRARLNVTSAPGKGTKLLLHVEAQG